MSIGRNSKAVLFELEPAWTCSWTAYPACPVSVQQKNVYVFGVICKENLWDPKHGRRSRGRPATTFVDQLEEDTGFARQELPAVMAERVEGDKLIKSVRVRPKDIDR